MSSIIKISNNDDKDRTSDSIKYRKDCPDFKCLDDGTVLGECKYCNHSTICRQIGVLMSGDVVAMTSDYLPIVDVKGEVITHELFCTGIHDLRPLKERIEDDKVS